jgi:ABC-type dipeptide/oligopeptide/nickel transport system ATPase component
MWRGPMLHRALEQFLSDVHWGELDTLLVDMPPGTGDVAISLGQLLPRAEAVVVTTPQPLAQEVAARAALMARKTNMRLIGVVENMSGDVFGLGGGDVLAEELDVPLLGRVALDAELRVCGDGGEPLVAARPESPRAQELVRIAEAIEATRIEPFVDRLARALSGGMLRRLEIASALLNRPSVMFLDEPTVGLDPTARRLVWERLEALREEVGTTLLVTTHMMEEAESRCGRVAIIDRGRIAAQGTPAELRARTGEENLDGVFAAVTGHELAEDEGRFRDVRAGRRLARRLG